MKKFDLVMIIVAIAAHGAVTGTARAAENVSKTAVTASARTANPLGVYLGVGTPNPGILSLNVGYNLIDMMRVEAGYSSISAGIGAAEASAKTLGFGVRGFMPGWSLTPTVGLHFANVSYSATPGMSLEVGGFTQSGSHLYSTLGIDYVANSGFHGGLGYSYSFKSGVGGSTYVQLGWFFDIFNS